jgi:hypothetical protein
LLWGLRLEDGSVSVFELTPFLDFGSGGLRGYWLVEVRGSEQ